MTQLTVCVFGSLLTLRSFRARGKAPAEQHQTQGLPTKVRRQYKEPRDSVTGSNSAAQSREKFTVPMAAVVAKNALANKIDGHRHHDKSEEQETYKQTCFLADNFCQCTGIFGQL